MSNIGKALLYVVYLSFIILVCLEVLMRLWGYSEMYLYDPIYMPFAKSSEIPFVMKPNLANVRAHGKIRINTDVLGLRSPTPGAKIPAKGPGEYRIAFLGDSVTFGVGVATTDTYPEVVQDTLNHRLQKRYQIKVFNFAISSYSVKEMTATLKYRVPEVSPDLVIMGIIINDFDTSRTPGVDASGYNTHSGAAELVNKYSRIKSILRKLHLSYLIRDFLSPIFKQREAEVELMQGKMPDWIAESYRYVLDFKRIANEYGYQYLVVTLPSVGENGSQFQEITYAFKHDQINFYDISTIASAFSIKEYQASRYDWHPSALLHRRIGELLSTYVMAKFINKPLN